MVLIFEARVLLDHRNFLVVIVFLTRFAWLGLYIVVKLLYCKQYVTFPIIYSLYTNYFHCFSRFRISYYCTYEVDKPDVFLIIFCLFGLSLNLSSFFSDFHRSVFCKICFISFQIFSVPLIFVMLPLLLAYVYHDLLTLKGMWAWLYFMIL